MKIDVDFFVITCILISLNKENYYMSHQITLEDIEGETISLLASSSKDMKKLEQVFTLGLLSGHSSYFLVTNLSTKKTIQSDKIYSAIENYNRI